MMGRIKGATSEFTCCDVCEWWTKDVNGDRVHKDLHIDNLELTIFLLRAELDEALEEIEALKPERHPRP